MLGGRKIYKENDIYVVGSGTMGLREANHPVYRIIIQDVEGIFYSKKTALQLLNESCLLKGGSDYRGKILAVKFNFSFKNKTPLIISITEGIYAFPTKSPLRHDCRWIFPEHVEKIIDKDGEKLVVFKNGQTFPLNCSEYTFREQLKRASFSFFYFQKRNRF